MYTNEDAFDRSIPWTIRALHIIRTEQSFLIVSPSTREVSIVPWGGETGTIGPLRYSYTLQVRDVRREIGAIDKCAGSRILGRTDAPHAHTGSCGAVTHGVDVG